MSQTNRLILRRPNPRELFQGVCQVCVGAGHVDLAVVDLSEFGEVQRCTSGASTQAPVTTTAESLLDGAHTQLLMMTLAVRCGEDVVVNDVATDTVPILSPSQAERVRLITHAGWHPLGLVNDVMDISRIESGRFDVVNVCSDISSVLDDAVALTQTLARTHQVELVERAVWTYGIGAVADPRRLHQVMLNILSNACKYNQPGGLVRVDVTHSDAEVFLDAVDDGDGMSDDQLAHLFEPFDRLGNEGRAIEGSGISRAVSANAMATNVATALKMGALDHTTKPLNLEAPLGGVNQLLERSAPVAIVSDTVGCSS